MRLEPLVRHRVQVLLQVEIQLFVELHPLVVEKQVVSLHWLEDLEVLVEEQLEILVLLAVQEMILQLVLLKEVMEEANQHHLVMLRQQEEVDLWL